MRKQWIKVVTALIGVIMILPGCGINVGKNPDKVRTQSYADDGYLGRSSGNPRLPGHHIVTNYGTDNTSMREAIRNVPGVADSSVTFNGADAYVTIKLAPDLMAREIPTVEQQAATVLRFNYPRYIIHVTSMR